MIADKCSGALQIMIASLKSRQGVIADRCAPTSSFDTNLRRSAMGLIKDTVGTLPYKLVDFDQHSYESDDCFTRFMPKDKIDTAIYPIRNASGQKVLLAGNRIVNALEGDLDNAYVPGSLV